MLDFFRKQTLTDADRKRIPLLIKQLGDDAFEVREKASAELRAIGRKAIAAYVDGSPGRLMRSLKSVLGTALIEETTWLGRERTRFRDVIGYYLGAVKRRAEQATGRELRDVEIRDGRLV